MVILARALTVHKSQGSTLSRAQLSLTNTFDYGQAYVALSRVTDLQGLWLTKFIYANHIRANPEVLAFLSRINPDIEVKADSEVEVGQTTEEALSTAAPI